MKKGGAPAVTRRSADVAARWLECCFPAEKVATGSGVGGEEHRHDRVAENGEVNALVVGGAGGEGGMRRGMPAGREAPEGPPVPPRHPELAARSRGLRRGSRVPGGHGVRNTEEATPRPGATPLPAPLRGRRAARSHRRATRRCGRESCRQGRRRRVRVAVQVEDAPAGGVHDGMLSGAQPASLKLGKPKMGS